MSNLGEPKFQNLQHGECAGAPILKSLWDKFDLSYMLSQAGIHRNNGTPTWMLCFLYIIGLVCRCSSVLKMSELVAKDAVLSIMFRGEKLAQYTLSRFLTHNYDWVTKAKRNTALYRTAFCANSCCRSNAFKGRR
jgi:hypothetical protein